MGSHAFVMVCDYTEESIARLPMWYDEIQKFCPENKCIFLALSKWDKREEWTEKKKKDVVQFAEDHSIPHFFTSAKLDQQSELEEMFLCLGRKVLRQKGYIIVDKVWRPDLESCEMYGQRFRRVVFLLLLFRNNTKTLFHLLPRPILYKILSQLSLYYLRNPDFLFFDPPAAEMRSKKDCLSPFQYCNIL